MRLQLRPWLMNGSPLLPTLLVILCKNAKFLKSDKVHDILKKWDLQSIPPPTDESVERALGK
eukprot:12426003-Karenia_brevis.AAC.1